MIKISSALLFFICSVSLSYSQSSVNSSGTDLIGSGSINYSVGQLVTNTEFANGTLFQGVQIANVTFILKADDEISLSNQALVYPNPTVGNATLELPSKEGNVSYVLFSADGKQLLKNNVSTTKTTVETNNLSSGVYYLQIMDKNNTSKTFKIIKQ